MPAENVEPAEPGASRRNSSPAGQKAVSRLALGQSPAQPRCLLCIRVPSRSRSSAAIRTARIVDAERRSGAVRPRQPSNRSAFFEKRPLLPAFASNSIIALPNVSTTVSMAGKKEEQHVGDLCHCASTVPPASSASMVLTSPWGETSARGNLILNASFQRIQPLLCRARRAVDVDDAKPSRQRACSHDLLCPGPMQSPSSRSSTRSANGIGEILRPISNRPVPAASRAAHGHRLTRESRSAIALRICWQSSIGFSGRRNTPCRGGSAMSRDRFKTPEPDAVRARPWNSRPTGNRPAAQCNKPWMLESQVNEPIRKEVNGRAKIRIGRDAREDSTNGAGLRKGRKGIVSQTEWIEQLGQVTAAQTERSLTKMTRYPPELESSGRKFQSQCTNSQSSTRW